MAGGRSRMSLRLRLTLVVAVTFGLVVVGSVYAAHVSARHQLRAAADNFLLQRSDRFADSPPGNFPHGGQPTGGATHPRGAPRPPPPPPSPLHPPPPAHPPSPSG